MWIKQLQLFGKEKKTVKFSYANNTIASKILLLKATEEIVSRSVRMKEEIPNIPAHW